MINDVINMSGYGIYVWSAYSFTLLSFLTLYLIIKLQLTKEELKFKAKFKDLSYKKAESAKSQKVYREILTSSFISKI